MSLAKYDKHVRSKYKRYVATDENGKILFEAGSKNEFAVLNKKHHESIEEPKKEEVPKKVDPDTGERFH